MEYIKYQVCNSRYLGGWPRKTTSSSHAGATESATEPKLSLGNSVRQCLKTAASKNRVRKYFNGRKTHSTMMCETLG